MKLKIFSKLKVLEFKSTSATQLAFKECCKIVHVASATIVLKLRAKSPHAVVGVSDHRKSKIGAVTRILLLPATAPAQAMYWGPEAIAVTSPSEVFERFALFGSHIEEPLGLSLLEF